MSLLDQIKENDGSGKKFIVLYGQDKIGKTTWANSAPNCLTVGPEAERGTKRIKGSKFIGCPTYEKNIEILEGVLKDNEGFETLIYESADWLEKIAGEKIVKGDGAKNLVEALNGYGWGYKAAEELQETIIDLLERIRTEKNMNVIVTGHYSIAESKDPNTDSNYNRYQIKLREKTASYWREIADAIFFCYYEVEKGKKEERAFSDGTRFIGVNWEPAFDAGNCFGLTESFKMLKVGGWEDLIKRIGESEPDKILEYQNEINSLREVLAEDKERLKKMDVATAKAIAAEDISKLETIIKQLKTIKEGNK